MTAPQLRMQYTPTGVVASALESRIELDPLPVKQRRQKQCKKTEEATCSICPSKMLSDIISTHHHHHHYKTDTCLTVHGSSATPYHSIAVHTLDCWLKKQFVV